MYEDRGPNSVQQPNHTEQLRKVEHTQLHFHKIFLLVRDTFHVVLNSDDQIQIFHLY